MDYHKLNGDIGDGKEFENAKWCRRPVSKKGESIESQSRIDDEEDELEIEDDQNYLSTEQFGGVSMEYCSQSYYTGPVGKIQDLLTYEQRLLEPKLKSCSEPVFHDVEEKWGHKEELLLLQLIETFGFYQWKLIAEQLVIQSGIQFTAKEAEEHYTQYYVNGTLGQVWKYCMQEKPVICFDHTADEPINSSGTNKYLPVALPNDLKSIKLLPHREEFEEYPDNHSEVMLSCLDFSSFYMNNLKELKIDAEVKELQLAIVDSYRRKVAERIVLRKFMKDFSLIEQFFLRIKSKPPFGQRTCKLEKNFLQMQKFISLFNSAAEFYDFYFDCVKEELIKLEIARLVRSIKAKRRGNAIEPRDGEMKNLIEKRAPGCFSMMSRILYCSGRGKRGNSNLQGERDQSDSKWLFAHNVLYTGFIQGKLQVISKKNSSENLGRFFSLKQNCGFGTDKIVHNN